MRSRYPLPRRRTRGFSLVSLLVGMSLGLIACAAAFATFRVVSAAYGDIVDHLMTEERGQRALAILSYAVRHAGHAYPAASSITLAAADGGTHRRVDARYGPSPFAALPAPIVGHDDCGALTFDGNCTRKGVQHSDVLRLRMSGSSQHHDPILADGTMIDCGGFPLPARSMQGTEHASNVFYIGRSADDVPQLMCRYPTRRDGRMPGHRYTYGPLVRGVETLQLRYGVDVDNDGIIESFVRADALHARGIAAWHAVRAVRIAIVMRGDRFARGEGRRALTLFDDADHDDRFTPTRDLDRQRRVLTTTVRLRNLSSCREVTC